MKPALYFLALLLFFNLIFAACPLDVRPTVYTSIVISQDKETITFGAVAFVDGTLKKVAYPVFFVLISGVNINNIECNQAKPCIYRITGNENGYAVLSKEKLLTNWGNNLENASLTVVLPYYNVTKFCYVGESLGFNENNYNDLNAWRDRFSNLNNLGSISAEQIPCFPNTGQNNAILNGSCDINESYIPRPDGRKSQIVPSPATFSTIPPNPPKSSLSFGQLTQTNFFWPLFICTLFLGLLIAGAIASGSNPFFWLTLEASSKKPLYISPGSAGLSFEKKGYLFGSKALAKTERAIRLGLGAGAMLYGLYGLAKNVIGSGGKKGEKEQGSGEGEGEQQTGGGKAGEGKAQQAGGLGSAVAPGSSGGTGGATPAGVVKQSNILTKIVAAEKVARQFSTPGGLISFASGRLIGDKEGKNPLEKAEEEIIKSAMEKKIDIPREFSFSQITANFVKQATGGEPKSAAIKNALAGLLHGLIIILAIYGGSWWYTTYIKFKKDFDALVSVIVDLTDKIEIKKDTENAENANGKIGQKNEPTEQEKELLRKELGEQAESLIKQLEQTLNDIGDKIGKDPKLQEEFEKQSKGKKWSEATSRERIKFLLGKPDLLPESERGQIMVVAQAVMKFLETLDNRIKLIEELNKARQHGNTELMASALKQIIESKPESQRTEIEKKFLDLVKGGDQGKILEFLKNPENASALTKTISSDQETVVGILNTKSLGELRGNKFFSDGVVESLLHSENLRIIRINNVSIVGWRAYGENIGLGFTIDTKNNTISQIQGQQLQSMKFVNGNMQIASTIEEKDGKRILKIGDGLAVIELPSDVPKDIVGKKIFVTGTNLDDNTSAYIISEADGKKSIGAVINDAGGGIFFTNQIGLNDNGEITLSKVNIESSKGSYRIDFGNGKYMKVDITDSQYGTTSVAITNAEKYSRTISSWSIYGSTEINIEGQLKDGKFEGGGSITLNGKTYRSVEEVIHLNEEAVQRSTAAQVLGIDAHNIVEMKNDGGVVIITTTEGKVYKLTSQNGLSLNIEADGKTRQVTFNNEDEKNLVEIIFARDLKISGHSITYTNPFFTNLKERVEETHYFNVDYNIRDGITFNIGNQSLQTTIAQLDLPAEYLLILSALKTDTLKFGDNGKIDFINPYNMSDPNVFAIARTITKNGNYVNYLNPTEIEKIEYKRDENGKLSLYVTTTDGGKYRIESENIPPNANLTPNSVYYLDNGRVKSVEQGSMIHDEIASYAIKDLFRFLSQSEAYGLKGVQAISYNDFETFNGETRIRITITNKDGRTETGYITFDKEGSPDKLTIGERKIDIKDALSGALSGIENPVERLVIEQRILSSLVGAKYERERYEENIKGIQNAIVTASPELEGAKVLGYQFRTENGQTRIEVQIIKKDGQEDKVDIKFDPATGSPELRYGRVAIGLGKEVEKLREEYERTNYSIRDEVRDLTEELSKLPNSPIKPDEIRSIEVGRGRGVTIQTSTASYTIEQAEEGIKIKDAGGNEIKIDDQQQRERLQYIMGGFRNALNNQRLNNYAGSVESIKYNKMEKENKETVDKETVEASNGTFEIGSSMEIKPVKLKRLESGYTVQYLPDYKENELQFSHPLNLSNAYGSCLPRENGNECTIYANTVFPQAAQPFGMTSSLANVPINTVKSGEIENVSNNSLGKIEYMLEQTEKFGGGYPELKKSIEMARYEIEKTKYKLNEAWGPPLEELRQLIEKQKPEEQNPNNTGGGTTGGNTGNQNTQNEQGGNAQSGQSGNSQSQQP